MSFRSSSVLALLFWVLSAGLVLDARAQRYEFPPRPQGPVLDRADLLSSSEQARLSRKLSGFEDTTSTAIVVVTLPSLNGAPISDYAFELGRTWGVGQESKNNGVVVLVSKGDREMFIATGYGVEGALPDAVANRIVERVMTPSFRQGRFYAGLDRGTDAIIQATKGEFDAEAPSVASADGDDIPVALIFLLLVLAYFLTRSFFRGGGGKTARRSRRDGSFIIWGGGASGGGGFSGGGGGFGGFGGGSFGGGGAGGSW